MWSNSQENPDLVKFNEKFLNKKSLFCAVLPHSKFHIKLVDKSDICLIYFEDHFKTVHHLLIIITEWW